MLWGGTVSLIIHSDISKATNHYRDLSEVTFRKFCYENKQDTHFPISTDINFIYKFLIFTPTHLTNSVSEMTPHSMGHINMHKMPLHVPPSSYLQ